METLSCLLLFVRWTVHYCAVGWILSFFTFQIKVNRRFTNYLVKGRKNLNFVQKKRILFCYYPYFYNDNLFLIKDYDYIQLTCVVKTVLWCCSSKKKHYIFLGFIWHSSLWRNSPHMTLFNSFFEHKDFSELTRPLLS
jgi:hypothetical protein